MVNKPETTAKNPTAILIGITGKINKFAKGAKKESLPNWNRIKGVVKTMAESVVVIDSLISKNDGNHLVYFSRTGTK